MERIHFGEADAAYATEAEFYEAVVSYMKSHYDVLVEEEKKKPRDDMKSYMEGGGYYN